ncbi:MAG: DUF3450 domain-containing protein [Gammaproteobacteria bacterium]|nr:DUF3450 domain-containing protein [Gammaproteobacteria bacterium]
MSEKFDEEEYHFVDDPDMSSYEEPAPDTAGAESAEPQASESETETPLSKIVQFVKPAWDMVQQNFILRTSLLVVSVVVVVSVIYRCSSNPLSEKISKKASSAASTQAKITPTISTQPKVTSAAPALAVSQPSIRSKTVEMQSAAQEKIAAFEKTQANLQSQIGVLSNQLAGMNTNFSTMMTNLKLLNDQVTQLAQTVEAQSKMTTALNEKIKQRERKVVMNKRPSMPTQVVRYALQAVIPGRAWLISTSGSTLTVREGTKIANYGVVRYIDAKRGRVLTSSGQVIRFAQDDS